MHGVVFVNCHYVPLKHPKQLSGRIMSQLYDCVMWRLCDVMTVWCDDCMTWWQCDVMTVWSDDCMTWWQCDVMTVWRDDCVTWWQCDVTTVWHVTLTTATATIGRIRSTLYMSAKGESGRNSLDWTKRWMASFWVLCTSGGSPTVTHDTHKQEERQRDREWEKRNRYTVHLGNLTNQIPAISEDNGTEIPVQASLKSK